MKKLLNRAYVEIGNICNLACAFCPGTNRAPRQMNEREFKTVCEALRPYTDYLYFHVMGEPLLHPLLGELLEIAGEYGFRVCITTNGTLLASEENTLFRHADVLHKVSISLHSMEGNSIGDGEKYLAEAIAFSRRAAERGIYSVLRLWNLDTEARRGKNDRNAEVEARLRAAFPGEWTSRVNGYRLARNIFLEYAGIFTWPTESDSDDVEDGYCHGLLDQIAVLADGTVVPCCLDAEGEIPLGNLFSQPLSEILSSPRAERMREGLNCGKFTEALCKKCTYARRFHR